MQDWSHSRFRHRELWVHPAFKQGTKVNRLLQLLSVVSYLVWNSRRKRFHPQGIVSAPNDETSAKRVMGSLATDVNDGEKEIHVLVTGFGVRSSISAHHVFGLSCPSNSG